MVAKDDPAIRRHEVPTVAEPLGGRGARIVEREDPRGDERAVEAVADGVRADRGDEQPGSADVLAATQREDGERAGAGERDEQPAERGQDARDRQPGGDGGRHAANLRAEPERVNTAERGVACARRHG